jgi:hypothetical protein
MTIDVVFLFLRHSFANFGLLHASIDCEDSMKRPFASAHAGGRTFRIIEEGMQ